MNLYEILGVSKSADYDTIKNAYRNLSRKYHPDNLKEDATEEKRKEYSEIQKNINIAWDILSNEQKRREYNLNFNESQVYGTNFNTNYNDNYSNIYEDMVSNIFNEYDNSDMFRERSQKEIDLSINISKIKNNIEKAKREEKLKAIYEYDKKYIYTIRDEINSLSAQLEKPEKELSNEQKKLIDLRNKIAYRMMPKRFEDVEKVILKQIEEKRKLVEDLRKQIEIKKEELFKLDLNRNEYEQEYIKNSEKIKHLYHELKEAEEQLEKIKYSQSRANRR